MPFRAGGDGGGGGALSPLGAPASVGLVARVAAERARVARAHLRGVPQGQVLHHRARAPRPVACRRVLVLLSETVKFFFALFLSDCLLIH